MVICRLCQDAMLKDGDRDGICRACRESLAIPDMPPPRRPPLPCHRCGGLRFVRALVRDLVPVDVDVRWTGAVKTIAMPVAMTWAVRSEPLRIGVATVGATARVGEPLGKLSRYMCAGCGFVEIFCDEPEAVPIGVEYATDVVEYQSRL